MGDQAFMEAYYGKLPEFEEIEKCFGIIQEKARKEGYNSNPNKYPETKRIQNLFSKVFGLKKTIFYWVPSNVVNAYTVTVYSFMLFGESKDYIEKRKDKGFYDTSGRSVFTVYAYTGLLQKEVGLTPKELTSILLHEFGHNFDYSKYHMISFLLDVIVDPTFIYTVNANKTIEDHNDVKTDYLKEVRNEYDSLYKDKKARKRKDDSYRKALEKALNKGVFAQTISFLMKFATLPAVAIIGLPIQLLSLDGKKGELFADSFATAYGYGSDLISGLEKLGNTTVPVKHTKALDILRDLNSCMDEIFNGILEIHGSNQERCRATIKKLEADIKSGDYPPELKEELYLELDKMKERYHQMMTISPEDTNKIQKVWRKICNIIFRGAPNIAKFFKANRV